MQLRVNTYIPGASPVHRCDARVKVLLLAAFSVALFLVDTWLGMALAAAAFGLVLAASRIPPSRVFSLAVPVYVLVAFAVLFNSLVLTGAPGFPLAFSASGCSRGCFYAVRILLLVFASLTVCFTTASTDLTDALASFLGPLRRVRVPVDDIATVLSIALRFIPVTAEELGRVRDAQWSRGASFGAGSLTARLRAWQTVLIPLFVALFRRADTLACAMDARCYGAPGLERSSLSDRHLTGVAAAIAAGGLTACILLAALL